MFKDKLKDKYPKTFDKINAWWELWVDKPSDSIPYSLFIQAMASEKIYVSIYMDSFINQDVSWKWSIHIEGEDHPGKYWIKSFSATNFGDYSSCCENAMSFALPIYENKLKG